MALGANHMQATQVPGVVGEGDAMQGAVPRLVELGQTLVFGHPLCFFGLDEFDAIFLNPFAHHRQTVGRNVFGSIARITPSQVAPNP